MKILKESRNEKQAGKDFEKKSVKSGNSSSVAEAVLCRMTAFVAVRRQMMMSLSRDVFSSSQDVSKKVEHSADLPHGQTTHKKCERG